MLIHFLNDYNILGRAGDRIRIKGVFPGIDVDDYVYLSREDDIDDGEQRTYRIERIDYEQDNVSDYFGAVIVRD